MPIHRYTVPMKNKTSNVRTGKLRFIAPRFFTSGARPAAALAAAAPRSWTTSPVLLSLSLCLSRPKVCLFASRARGLQHREHRPSLSDSDSGHKA